MYDLILISQKNRLPEVILFSERETQTEIKQEKQIKLDDYLTINNILKMSTI